MAVTCHALSNQKNSIIDRDGSLMLVLTWAFQVVCHASKPGSGIAQTSARPGRVTAPTECQTGSLKIISVKQFAEIKIGQNENGNQCQKQRAKWKDKQEARDAGLLSILVVLSNYMKIVFVSVYPYSFSLADGLGESKK